MGSSNLSVRPAACAGTWYPGEPAALSHMVSDLLAAAPRSVSSDPVRALVVPHAGLRYSGATAAAAYAQLHPAAFTRVVVLAPSHRVPLRGAAVDPSTQYDTPLGGMHVDTDVVARLAENPLFRPAREAFALEHAIEMQLPFLKALLPDAALVPILIGELRAGGAAAVAAVLEPLLDGRSLLVVSTDLTHFGDAFSYRPFADDVPRQIAALDRRAIDAVLAGSAESLRQMLDETGATICGRNPLQVLLALHRRNWNAELLHYTTSGELTGDWDHCVSYASLVFREPATSGATDERRDAAGTRKAGGGAAPQSNQDLSNADRALLLLLARRTLDDLDTAARDPGALIRATGIPDRLLQPAGVFVSLHRKRDGRLRGCIGWVQPREPLAMAVVANTLGAARRDPRFGPVKSSDADALDIEISVLGPLCDVTDIAAIEIGRHGVMVTQGEHHAVLLPQVPLHFGWDRVAFLENVCRKADLDANAWQHGARLQYFEADVFAENPTGDGRD